HTLLRDVAGAACFTAFILGAWLSGPRPGTAPTTAKRRASAFAVGVLALTLGVGATERDLYPFSPWDLVAWIYPDSVSYYRVLGVDAAGLEHEVDHRAWQPLSVDELLSWTSVQFMALDSVDRERVAKDLVGRANAAASRVQQGRTPSGS